VKFASIPQSAKGRKLGDAELGLGWIGGMTWRAARAALMGTSNNDGFFVDRSLAWRTGDFGS
jgi:hypothetical protein